MSAPVLNGARRAIGVTLVLAGALLLLATLAGYAEGPVWQRLNGREGFSRVPLRRPVAPGEPFARLWIPRIGLNVMIVEGTGRQDLLKGPGHLIGSAAPGATDNCVLAGHRDLHFRGLERLRPGDVIQMEAEGRRLRYRVEGRKVIDPSDRAVLASTHEPILTLLTCYPFRHIGPAPRRYVVRARLESAVPLASRQPHAKAGPFLQRSPHGDQPLPASTKGLLPAPVRSWRCNGSRRGGGELDLPV